MRKNKSRISENELVVSEWKLVELNIRNKGEISKVSGKVISLNEQEANVGDTPNVINVAQIKAVTDTGAIASAKGEILKYLHNDSCFDEGLTYNRAYIDFTVDKIGECIIICVTYYDTKKEKSEHSEFILISADRII